VKFLTGTFAFEPVPAGRTKEKAPNSFEEMKLPMTII
jgi:hypothetical protein